MRAAAVRAAHLARRVTIACGLLALATPTGAQPRVGTLHVIWGDPRTDDEAPRYAALLDEGGGRITMLDVDHRDSHLVSQVVRLNGQRVAAEVDAPWTTGALRQGAAPGPAALVLTQVAAAPLPGAALRVADAPAWSVTRRPYAVVLCKFSDVATEPLPPQRYVEMYGPQPGGADFFFLENSRGRLTLAGTTVVGWVTMPKVRTAYLTSAGEANLPLLTTDCLGAADAQVDYSKFGGFGMHFNGALGCCSWGGSTGVSFDGPTRTMPTMWNMDWARSGTVWHEAGHSFGLPHSSGPYGAVYDSQWDVMSSSSTGSFLSLDFGRAGSHFIGWHKDRLGLIPADAVVELGGGEWKGVIEPHSRARPGNVQLLKVRLASQASGRLFTVEARQRAGTDRSVPAEGIVLALVDPGRSEPAQVIDVDGNGDPNDGGAVFTVGERYEDAARGIQVSVDSLTASGLAVTVRHAWVPEGVAALAPSFGANLITRVGSRSDTAWTRDSVRVSAGGAWRLLTTAFPAWLRAARSSGFGDGWFTFEWRALEMPVGRATTSLELNAPGGVTRSTLRVELGIEDATTTDYVAINRPARRVIVPGIGLVDTLALLLRGRYAAVTWSATATPGMQVRGADGRYGATASGVGSSTLRFSNVARSTPGLAVDTMRITVAGVSTPLLFIDSVEVVSGLGEATFSARRPAVTLTLGAAPQVDSVQVTIGGAATLWSAFRRRTDSQVLRSSGASDDWLVWRRTPQALGRTIDTVFVNQLGSGMSTVQRFFVDTMTVEDVPLRLRLERTGARRTVMLGRLGRFDSVRVELLGSAGTGLTWNASASGGTIRLHSRDAFITAGRGITRDFLRWSRNTALLAPGTYVDTLAVRVDGAAGSPARFIDTTVVLAPGLVAGDADVDGSVSAADGVAVLRSLVQLPVSSRAQIRPAGDANCDGAISIADALIILQIDAGIVPTNSCVGRALGAGG